MCVCSIHSRYVRGLGWLVKLSERVDTINMYVRSRGNRRLFGAFHANDIHSRNETRVVFTPRPQHKSGYRWRCERCFFLETNESSVSNVRVHSRIRCTCYTRHVFEFSTTRLSPNVWDYNTDSVLINNNPIEISPIITPCEKELNEKTNSDKSYVIVKSLKDTL